MMAKKRLLIFDTWGAQPIPPILREKLPHATFYGHTPPGADVDGTTSNPHAIAVAYYFGILLYPEPIDIHFAQIFDQDGKSVGAIGSDWHLAMYDEVHPTDDNNSWGRWDMDISGNLLESEYRAMAKKLDDKIRAVGSRSTWATGNNDKNDADNDISSPQRFMQLAVRVGSRNREGIPSVWSSDGDEAENTQWAEGIWLLDPTFPGDWAIGSGTSFGSPKTGSIRSVMQLSKQQWVDTLISDNEFITRPAHYAPGEHHPKTLYGDAEELFQFLLRTRVPPELWPPHNEALEGVDTTPRWFDKQCLQQEEKGETEAPKAKLRRSAGSKGTSAKPRKRRPRKPASKQATT
jgi:hypothetical protein